MIKKAAERFIPLVKSDVQTQIKIAIVLIAVIPSLTLFYLGTVVGSDVNQPTAFSLILILLSTVAVAIPGLSILIKYPYTTPTLKENIPEVAPTPEPEETEPLQPLEEGIPEVAPAPEPEETKPAPPSLEQPPEPPAAAPDDTRSIPTLREHITNVAKDSLQGKFTLVNIQDSDDIQYIEDCFDLVLEEMKYRIKLTEEQLRIAQALRKTVERQQHALLDAERHRAMIQTLGAACHHIGQPATVLQIRLEFLKKLSANEEELEEIDECVTAIQTISDVLQQLRQVSEFRTVPYVQTEDNSTDAILAIGSHSNQGASDDSIEYELSAPVFKTTENRSIPRDAIEPLGIS